uniref:Uncharacterized protein n=1 Tax=Clastoptera arizonana TaxID=38151 RepID=A0A1B6CGA4_9HEMI
MDTERNLIYLYLGNALCGVTSSVSLAIVWSYWNYALNSCVNEEENCGCILYSTATFNTFTGGTRFFCRFYTYIQIPVVFWAVFTLFFHTYRVCIPTKSKRFRRRGERKVTFNEDGIRSSRLDISERSPPCYTLFAVVSALIGFLLLAQVWIITGGYYFTCREYRKAVAKQLMANGQLSELVFDRLSCESMLDFLDYLQPDPETLLDKYRRHYRIHTAYFLQVALVSSWVSCTLWIATALYNLHKVFEKRK